MTGSGDIALFALGASRPYGEAVSAELGIALGTHEEREFEDGEHKARPLLNVRGRDAFVIHSLYSERGASANDKLVRLLFFIGALKDAAAARVTAVVPYLAYARKDRKTKPRDPVSTRYVATMFEAVGTDCIMTLDVHNLAAYQNAFRCRSEHLEAAGLFAAHFAPLVGAGEVVVVSPDAGGIKRAERLRTLLGARLGRPVGAAFGEKYRSGGVVSGEAFVGDVAGKAAIIVDDLISAGSTIARTARACREHGAAHISAAAAHGIFAAEANDVLAQAPLDGLVVTDTIAPGRINDPGLRSRLVTLPTAPLVAAAIARMHSGGSLVELLEG